MRNGPPPDLAYSAPRGTPDPTWPAWLAAAIIRQALRDVSSSSVDLLTRTSARRFLAGSKAFLTWCHVAGLDPDYLLLLCRAHQLEGRAVVPRRTGP